jgi:hypothetical protein
MSAPRITPLAMAISVLKPETNAARTPSAIIGFESSVAFRASSNEPLSTPSASVCLANSSSALSVTALIWSSCSVTPRTVPTTTPPIRTSRPRTTTPAARVGLRPCSSSVPTRGLKITASTAANVSGRAISLTAPSAPNTTAAATTNPTKLHAQIPIRGTRRSGDGLSLDSVSPAASVLSDMAIASLLSVVTCPRCPRTHREA